MPVSVGPNYTPDRIAAHGEERLAKFKIPRYIAYVEDFLAYAVAQDPEEGADRQRRRFARRRRSSARQALAVTAGQAFY